MLRLIFHARKALPARACYGKGHQASNATIVRESLAWAFVRYSESYAAQRCEAWAVRRGMFAPENMTP